MSIAEQIELFYDADYVIGVHGAGLVNIIFSSQINVLEIFPTSYVIPHYFYLSKSYFGFKSYKVYITTI